jgi:hypothetical protein
MLEVPIILTTTQLFCHLFYIVMKFSHFKRRTKLQVSEAHFDLHLMKGKGESYVMRTFAVCVELYGSG